MSVWQRWVQNTRNVLEPEPDMRLRAAHWVAYKALLADLEWEGKITEDELLRRMRKVKSWELPR